MPISPPFKRSLEMAAKGQIAPLSPWLDIGTISPIAALTCLRWKPHCFANRVHCDRGGDHAPRAAFKNATCRETLGSKCGTT